jgi:uncharacterized protein (DUF983 family)
MKVTHGQIITRGLSNRCPNCGGRTLFKEGTLFELNLQCKSCGLKIEKDEGFYLGAMAINYGVTCICFLSPVAIMWYYGILGNRTATVLAIVLALGVPVILYRASRSWQLMLYYSMLPQHLPANRRQLEGMEDENV